MRAPAEIDKRTASVNSALLSSHKLVNIVQLVLAVRKHLLEVLLGNLQSVETLLLLENFRCPVVKDLPICLFNDAAAKENISIC